MDSKVYLIGAGPGNPELLTVRAHKLISMADVIYYDRLMSSEILELAPEHCEKVFVGKKEKRHFSSQDETNNLLVAASQKYKTIIRLKGGDSFVFGRGSEELLALQATKVPFEVIPGISSSMAAPTYAGIPLTHRKLARSFSVVTGHLSADSMEEINWANFVDIDTVVVLMGVGQRQHIASSLIKAGRDENQSVAFVENATTPRQRVVTSTLLEVAAGNTQVNCPAVTIIGKVVDLREELNWFHNENTNDQPVNELLENCIF